MWTVIWPTFIQLCCCRHRKSFGSENDFPDRLWFNYSLSDQLSTRKMTARSSIHAFNLLSLPLSLFLQSLSSVTVRFSSFCPMLILNTCINAMMYFPWLQSNGNTRAGRKMGNILLQTMEKWITMTDSNVFLACFTVERRNCLKLNICGRRGELRSAITFIALRAEAGICSLALRYVLEASHGKSNGTHTVLGSNVLKVAMLM